MWCYNIGYSMLLQGGITMAKQCYVCEKKAISGNAVSHSNRHTRRIWKPNLRKVNIIEDGTPKKVYVCTRCLRSDKVSRA